jgi:hypothetical protein
LHDHRITGNGWVGLAQEHSITVEHHVNSDRYTELAPGRFKNTWETSGVPQTVEGVGVAA